MARSHKQFREAVAGADAAVDLAEASLLIAREEYPTLDVDAYLARLDQMGAAVAERLPAHVPRREAIGHLNRYLFEEEGFRGNNQDYYDPRNSFLNEVLDRRTGIPITLSAVYREVGRRAGIPVQGVGLPGHFIVKVEDPAGDLLVDPFHRGTMLSEADCQKRLDRVYAGRVRMEPRMLNACGPKEMLGRMLRNLKGIYVKTQDFNRALGVVEMILSVQPDSLEDLRDRGLIYAGLDCYGLAVRDLEAYSARTPPGTETQDLAVTLAALRLKAARLN